MKKLMNFSTIFTLTLSILSSCGKKTTEYVNGSSCSVTPVLASQEYPNGGAVIVCGQQMVVVENGDTGPTGANSVLEVIDPCGNTSNIYDEVILRLSTGQLLASFSDNSNGKNTRFVILTQGNYVTTDGSNCHFSVDANGNLNW